MTVLNKELENVKEFLNKDGIKDLKNNLLKKQMKLQTLNASKQEQNYDILLSILYRTSEERRSPIGLYLLSAYVEQFGYSAKVLDISAQSVFDILESEIFSQKTHIIGFYCSYDNKFLVSNTIKYLKENTNVITFVGGPQAVDLDEDFLRETGCDVITEGEGEEALKELLDYYINKKGSLKDIKNIKYIDENNQYHQNEIREPIKDLDKLPFPRLVYDSKSESQISYMGYILTGRGCPFRCAFCYEGAHSKLVRYRSIKNVFDEIDCMIREYPQIMYIQVYDDTFTLDINRVRAFCNEMKKVREYHNLFWCCEAHVNTIHKNPQMIEEMMKAGLHSIQIGIESGSQRVLESYNKHTTPEMICDVVKMCNDLKLTMLEGNIIVGGAWETQETIEQSIEMSKKLIRAGKGMIELYPLFYTPFPKTPMSRCPENYGIKIIENQVDKTISSMRNAVVETEYLSREDIIEAKKRIEKVMLDEYRKMTLELDRKTIFRKFLTESGSIKTECRWGMQISGFEHLRNYIKMASDKEYSFGNITDFEKWYPVRTFELLEYVDNSLFVNGLVFNNIQMKLLEYSTGRYSIEQIAEIVGMSSEAVFKACNELEERCLIYYSRI